MLSAVVPPIPPDNQPLGPNLYNVECQTKWHSAYDQCLLLDTAVATQEQQRSARCLGYLLVEAVDSDSRDYVAEEINKCGGDIENLMGLSRMYIDHLFRLFRQNKGETPPLSPDHADLDPYERCSAFFAKKVEHAPANHRSAKRAALHRDGYCCVATNVIDSDYIRTISREVIDAHVQAGFGIESTKLAHIFPPFAARGPETEPGRSETDYSSAVCATVKSFAHIDIPAELSGTQFHRLSNILTLSCGMWALFNELEVWFEEVPDMPNSYYVCESQRGYLWGIRNRLITFTPRDGLEVPDPRCLKLHAVVCRVALMSGVSKYLNSYDREHEHRGTLALSGASADFLTARLNKVLVES